MKLFFVKHKITAILLLICFCPALATAQQKAIAFDVDGLKVILKQTQKETIAMGMYFRGGVYNYPAQKAGIELLALDAAINCGSKSFKASEVDDQTDEFGLHLSAQAEPDFALIKLRCITRYVNEGWKVFSSAIVAPTFEDQKFSLLKNQRTEIAKAQLSNPDGRLERLIAESAFAKTPYATNPDGTERSLQSLNRDEVQAYYFNTLLNKKRMFLVVAGNISREELEKKVREAFSQIPAKEYAPAKTTLVPFSEETYQAENRPLATNYISGIFNAPSLADIDYPAFRLAISILNNRLFNEIRLNKRLSYAPSARFVGGKNAYAVMYASTTKPVETVKEMRTALKFIKDVTYTEAFIAELGKSQLQGYQKSQEAMSEIADALGNAEVMGDWQLAENFSERVSGVTAKDVREALKKYSTTLKWVYLGNKELAEASFSSVE